MSRRFGALDHHKHETPNHFSSETASLGKALKVGALGNSATAITFPVSDFHYYEN